VSTYERARIGRAFSNVRKFWNPDQILSSIMPPVIGLALLPLIKIFGLGLQQVANLKLAVLALACGIVACLTSWFLSFIVNYLWVSPAELHREQKGEIDRLTGETNAAVLAAQLKPDFRLTVDASAKDQVPMLISTAYPVTIPVIFLAVTNRGESDFDVPGYQISKPGQSPREFHTDLIVSPRGTETVPIQRNLIDIISDGVMPEHARICAAHQVLISIDCKGGNGHTAVRSDAKIFDVSIERTGNLAVDISILPGLHP